MTKEQMKKYFMEKYGVDIDNMPTEKVEVKDEEHTLIYDGIDEGVSSDEPFTIEYRLDDINNYDYTDYVDNIPTKKEARKIANKLKKE